MDLSKSIQRRFSFWWSAIRATWSRWMLAIGFIYGAMSNVSDFLPDKWQEWLHVSQWLPDLPLSIWAILLLALTVFVLFEAGYRANKTAKKENEKSIAAIKSEKDALLEAIRPKLRLVCEPGYPWIQANNIDRDPYTGIAMDGILYTCRLGIINPGLETIKNIHVRMIGISTGVLIGQPCYLHFMNDNSKPYKEYKDLSQTYDPSFRDALFVDVIQFYRFQHGTKRLAISSIVEGILLQLDAEPCTLELVIGSDNGGETQYTSLAFQPSDDGLPKLSFKGIIMSSFSVCVYFYTVAF